MGSSWRSSRWPSEHSTSCLLGFENQTSVGGLHRTCVGRRHTLQQAQLCKSYVDGVLHHDAQHALGAGRLGDRAGVLVVAPVLR